MTFYEQQVAELNIQLYPKTYLTQQIISSKHFIDKKFATKINLGELAAVAFLSKFHFTRLFKIYYGITPFQYLTEVRIENAKQLLKSGATLSETAAAIGFDSVTHFAGLFKKMTGYTPAAFNKKSNRQED